MSSPTSSPPAPPDDNHIVLSSPGAPFITLKYAQKGSCICDKQTMSQLATSLCPLHGYHDSKAKIVKRKSSCVADDSQEKERDGDYRVRRDRRDRGSQGRVRRRNTEPQSQPRRSWNPYLLRYPPVTSHAETTAVGVFAAELNLLNNNLRRILTSRSASDEFIHSVQFSERPPLTQIDFLDWPLEARKIVYRSLLVPATRAVIFPGKNSNVTFHQLNPDLNANILRTNSQVYSEARNILYSENNFTAAEPADFFYPNGVQGLRASTANKIKHISFLRRDSGPNLCDLNSQVLSTAILSLINQCPAFLNIATLTIRFEVLRPVTVNMLNLQVHYAHNGIDHNIRSAYNKTDVVIMAAATVAYRALKRKSPFQGLKEVEDRFESVCDANKDRVIKHVIEMCLFRTSEPVETYQKHSQMLREAIVDMLFGEKEREVPGADEKFRDFVRRYLM
ncbi:hypothetical protein AYL99_03859 [Fonsecaea erecta]|uniref:Uncharacterized protein n=1 Tax=Fonsecaea erecta TaxID=1367422 RepID=A0A178ZQL2_9EURO|nr:hypothetical protein AYL99_03859 [Fonsecaea erecta]OAP61656.1 hypothetical protein AYL99_03859 [Fonsecaea erecta]